MCLRARGKLPHILFYGHYDVQPADPLELWTSPPFEPEIRKGSRGQDAIFARGSSDDKGQLMTFLEASRSWLKVHGSLPFRLTVMIEGDEEGDASHIDAFLKTHAREFPVDAAFICDTGMWDEKTPGIDTSLRGCSGIEVTVTGPKIDLHSGLYGGPVQNPIKVLSRIVAAIHDSEGPHHHSRLLRRGEADPAEAAEGMGGPQVPGEASSLATLACRFRQASRAIRHWSRCGPGPRQR